MCKNGKENAKPSIRAAMLWKISRWSEGRQDYPSNCHLNDGIKLLLSFGERTEEGFFSLRELNKFCARKGWLGVCMCMCVCECVFVLLAIF